MNTMARQAKETVPKVSKPATAKADFDMESVLRRNQALESSGLDNFLIRLPRLKIHTHFYYKFVEDGECTIGDHGHMHWEITRIRAGGAAYTIPSIKQSILPDSDHYLIIPPRLTHSWRMTHAPLLMNSWQVHIAAEDSDGETVLKTLRKSVIEAGYLVLANSSQRDAEDLLWDMVNEERIPQIFGSILSGFARIIIGDLLAKLNPWPEHLLSDRHDPQLAARSLAARLRMFLDENIENPITLSDLEGHFHYSERHLNRIFQKVHNVSIGQYLRQHRIELAKRWLETTDRAVKNIAFSLGYSSPGQFCRYFSLQTGLTPSQYRTRQQVNKDDHLEKSTVKGSL